MFSNILLSFKTQKTKSFEALYTKVLSLRDIKDGTHIRMRNKFLDKVEEFISTHKEQFEYDGIEVLISLLPSTEDEVNQQDIRVTSPNIDHFMNLLKSKIEPILSKFYYELIEESHWTTREEDYRLEKSFDRSPFVAPQAKLAISSWNIGLTGDGPFKKEEIAFILRKCGVYKYNLRPRANDVIILGRKKYDYSRLKKFGKNSPIKHGRVFTQESFMRYLIFGEDYNVNEIIKNAIRHQGIEYLKKLSGKEFPWPEINYDSAGIKKLIAIEWSDESELRRLTGYSVAGEHATARIRRAQLRKGVGLIGLENVARHIARQLRQKLSRIDADYTKALLKWEDDLEWLYNTYYKYEKYQFPWSS